MDRWQALNKLDVIRPGADEDWNDPELADAIAALDADPDARREVDRRLQLDERIGNAMQDIAVPENLKASLLAAVGATENSEGVVVRVPATKKKFSRRAVLAATVAGLMLAVAGYFLNRPEEPLSFATLIKNAPTTLAQAQALPREELPFKESASLRYAFRSVPNDVSKGWSAGNNGHVTSAVYAGKGWTLIVTPLDTLQGVPTGTVAGPAGISRKVWEAEGMVFVMHFAGKPHELDALQTRMFGKSA